MRILILDTYYDAFLATLPPLTGTYEEELEELLSRGFGTHSGYSFYLKALGIDAIDIIANYHPLQELWEHERGLGGFVVGEQIAEFKPDVIFLQDVGYFPTERLREWKQAGFVIAAQCSCALDPSVDVTPIDVIFTSLPTHVEKFKAAGVQAVYLPLAFDPRMKPAETARDIDISFVGGVGRDSHWRAGTDVLEAVAAHFGERFHWYGYGLENLATDSPLRKCYRGTAWGREMYSIYGRSKIVVNRHGEIAQGYSNNLRMFEATGCGAMLMTESSKNSVDFFSYTQITRYLSIDDLIEGLNYLLSNDEFRQEYAELGQSRTLRNHTYTERMKTVSAVLSECLESRKVRT